MHNFTMGIIFSHDMESMYLLRKDHPEWQAGLLNGVGGKLKDGESYADCMAREAAEESGYTWNFVCLGRMRGEGKDAFQCEVFYSVMGAKGKEPHTCEAEKIEKHPVADLHKLIPEMVPHLPMLILAALNHQKANTKFSLCVTY